MGGYICIFVQRIGPEPLPDLETKKESSPLVDDPPTSSSWKGEVKKGGVASTKQGSDTKCVIRITFFCYSYMNAGAGELSDVPYSMEQDDLPKPINAAGKTTSN